MPEISGLSKADKKAALRACRWKPFKHWQYWLSFILYILMLPIINMLAGSIFFMFMTGFNSIMLMMLVLPFVTGVLLLYCGLKIHEYYLAPRLLQYVRDNYPDRVEMNADEQAAIQRKRRKKLFISLPIILAILPVHGIGFHQAASYKPRPMPASLKEPRVEINKIALIKTQALHVAGLGKVTDIVKLQGRGSDGEGMAIAGTQGAVLTDDRLSVKKQIAFDGKFEPVSVIQADHAGSLSYISRGSWARSPYVMDSTGKRKWSYNGAGTGVDDMAAGDLNGDGTVEYVVGFNGGGGVHLLNADGKKIWSKPDANVWHMEIVDVDGDGHPKIVHSNAAGDITIRDADGKILSKHKPQTYFSHFSIINLQTEKNLPYLLQNSDEKIWILDFKGETIKQLPAPFSCDGHAKGTVVKLDNNAPYIGVIADQYIWDRSVLFLYNASDRLVYHEILPEACFAIYAFQSPGGSHPSLLVGCKNVVWRYELRGD